MRSAARFQLLVDCGAHLGALVRLIERRSPNPVAYVIDLHDPFGFMWATALQGQFGKPDVDTALALAQRSPSPGRAISTGCAPASEMARLAAAITAGMERREAPTTLLADLIEVELRLGRASPAGTFRVLVVGDYGAEVAHERLEHPRGRA